MPATPTLVQLYLDAVRALRPLADGALLGVRLSVQVAACLRLCEACLRADPEPWAAQQALHHAACDEWSAAHTVLRLRYEVLRADLCERAEEF